MDRQRRILLAGLSLGLAARIRKLGLTPQQIMSRPAPFAAAEVPFHLLVRKTHPRAQEILRQLDNSLRKPGTARMIEDVTRKYLPAD
ncbi:MAG TPA: hypothetical protein VEC35_06000 [Noviherbaspirillum sp.]|nr:hypothetical protein [Noviherbaspirillum sp.]